MNLLTSYNFISVAKIHEELQETIATYNLIFGGSLYTLTVLPGIVILIAELLDAIFVTKMAPKILSKMGKQTLWTDKKIHKHKPVDCIKTAFLSVLNFLKNVLWQFCEPSLCNLEFKEWHYLFNYDNDNAKLFTDRLKSIMGYYSRNLKRKLVGIYSNVTRQPDIRMIYTKEGDNETSTLITGNYNFI